jgi:hypothetical protein
MDSCILMWYTGVLCFKPSKSQEEYDEDWVYVRLPQSTDKD